MSSSRLVLRLAVAGEEDAGRALQVGHDVTLGDAEPFAG